MPVEKQGRENRGRHRQTPVPVCLTAIEPGREGSDKPSPDPEPRSRGLRSGPTARTISVAGAGVVRHLMIALVPVAVDQPGQGIADSSGEQEREHGIAGHDLTDGAAAFAGGAFHLRIPLAHVLGVMQSLVILGPGSLRGFLRDVPDLILGLPTPHRPSPLRRWRASSAS